MSPRPKGRPGRLLILLALALAVVTTAAFSAPDAKPDLTAEQQRTRQPDFGGPAMGIAVFVAVWVLGIVYSDRAANDLFLNVWVGRAIGLIFPIIGPVVLGILRRRAQRYRHWPPFST